MTENWREVIIEREQEYRFEVDFGKRFKVKLVQGTAEIFGTELTHGPEYEFSGRKYAIFTWEGCRLSISGEIISDYVAEETPMTTYVNTHFALEKLRENARKQEPNKGPRVMIIGPEDSGKTSLCKILLSYAVKQGHKPTFINLDTSEGGFTIPGTLSATQVTGTLDILEGFGSSDTTGSTISSLKIPIVYFHGSLNYHENIKLHKLLVSKLAFMMNERMNECKDSNISGCIIDTPGYIDTSSIEIIQHSIQVLNVDILLIVGSERLYSDLSRYYSGTNLSIKPIILKIPKSGGVVNRDEGYKRQLQSQKIQEYFYGSQSSLSPINLDVNFSDFWIFRVGENTGLDFSLSSALPVGETSKLSETRMVPLDPEDLSHSGELLNSIVALSHADVISREEIISLGDDAQRTIIETEIAGFLHISNINMERKRLTILSPTPGRLPGRIILASSIKWQD